MSLERHLYIPDTHRPYHDKRAWALMLSVAKVFKPHTIISIGDFGDFYSVSGHSKDPQRDRRLRWEVQSVRAGLDDLDGLGARRKIFIEGNHEDRLRRYLQDKAPELFDVVNVPELLRLKERGWEFVPYKDHIRVGKVYFTHDVGSTGRYAAFRALDMYRHGVVTGHTHKMSYVVEGNLAGEQQLSVILGWLGDSKQIDYLQRGKAIRDCALGFGIGHLDTVSGLLYIQPIPLVKYTCLVDGKLYRG